MTELIDLHCHIVPYVDDGALRREESDELIDMLYQQGVRAVCATPHLRYKMFETPDETVIEQFRRMQERSDRFEEKFILLLSREYHCDALFFKKLEAREILPLGYGNTILIEFSYSHSEFEITDCVDAILRSGYRPLIAHVERYPALRSPESIKRLIQKGAMIQMNAGSVLGREGRKQASYCRKLIEAQLVHVIASDAHDPEQRPPELERCFHYLEKEAGNSYAENLMRNGPLQILLGIEGDTNHAER